MVSARWALIGTANIGAPHNDVPAFMVVFVRSLGKEEASAAEGGRRECFRLCPSAVSRDTSEVRD